jgi:hypothetical protein
MAKYYILYDDALETKVRGHSAESLGVHVDQEFDVGASPQEAFIVTQNFTAESQIDVFLNGVLLREGSGDGVRVGYTRYPIANEIFLSTPVKYSWVRIRVY